MMTPEYSAKLKRSIVAHEHRRKYPYTDTVGKVTIGIGYNLSDRGLSDDWIDKQYEEDAEYFYNKLNDTFPWFAELTDDRQIALIDMSFMGWNHFVEFTNMLDALANHDYNRAAYEMLNSEWAKQVKSRATNLAQVMLTGVYDI